MQKKLQGMGGQSPDLWSTSLLTGTLTQRKIILKIILKIALYPQKKVKKLKKSKNRARNFISILDRTTDAP